MLCCGYTLTDFPISIRLTSLALWQSNDCPSASKATLMNMDKYVMWIHYERLHNHNKAKHNTTMCIFLGIYCSLITDQTRYVNSMLTSVAPPSPSGTSTHPTMVTQKSMSCPEWITHIAFIPCQSVISFLRLGYFKPWPWNVKIQVMGQLKGQGHHEENHPFQLRCGFLAWQIPP